MKLIYREDLAYLSLTEYLHYSSASLLARSAFLNTVPLFLFLSIILLYLPSSYNWNQYSQLKLFSKSSLLKEIDRVQRKRNKIPKSENSFFSPWQKNVRHKIPFGKVKKNVEWKVLTSCQLKSDSRTLFCPLPLLFF